MNVPILAVTATATPAVLAEMRQLLGIDDCKVFQLGTSRDNLRISVRSRDEFASHVFSSHTIVYVSTRKSAKV